ncbi:hypothetical protein SNE40_015483 [Patella caerulea]|uniref:Uncharacterized protein n=1 Tax=Patella caerulea TaxID=87958 RepID=A0AAN8JKQ8_PATCE
MSSAVKLVLLFVLALDLQMALTSPSSERSRNEYELAAKSQELSRELELANRLLHRLMDVAYETAKDFGAKEDDLKNIKQKRNIITACYFQAITCY